MVKWLVSFLAVVAVASAGYAGPQQQEAPVLPKGGAPSVYFPSVQQAPPVQPVYQHQQNYGQQPAQTQPMPKPQQTYSPPQVELPRQQLPAPQSQPLAPEPRTYAPAPFQKQQQQQQQPVAPQPQTYAPQPQQQSYAPAPVQQQPAVNGYDRQQQFNPYGQRPQVQQTPPKPKETYCQQNNVVEGYHAPGCSKVYYACFPVDTIRMECPAGLYYDSETSQCDHKHHIVACGGSKPVPLPAQTKPLRSYGAPHYASAPAPVQQQQPAPQSHSYAPAPQAQTYAPAPVQQQQQPAPQQPLAPRNPYAPIQQAPPKPTETFCRDRSLSDGFYGKGCSNYFYVCAVGQTTRLDCPTGLFYDRETNECGHKAVIVACGGQKPTQPPAQQPPMPGPYAQALPAKQTPPPPEFDCSARKDGIYIQGCNSKYFICVQGTVMSLSCPSGTFYSAFTEMCDYKANVVECGGIAPTKPPVAQNPVLLPQSPYDRRPVQPAQQPPASQTSYGQSPAQQVPAKSNNPCATLSNGIYGRKCSRFFFVCATQKTYDFICPKDHAFNLKTVKCAPKMGITTCPEFETPEAPVQQNPPQPIEIKPQPAPRPQPQTQTYAPSYAAPAQQQPAAPQPQAYDSYSAPAPVQQQQQQPVAPQPQTYAPHPQQQSYAPAPVQQQQSAPQPQSYAPTPFQQQQPVAPQPQPTYQHPLVQQQQPAPRQQY